jgi:outer membrane protein TolC
LTASLPLFSGGSVSAAVREAKAIEVQQSERLKMSEREALDEGRDLWERYQSGRKQIALLEEAARRSEAFYRRVAQDERMGLASSLETLQALNSSIDSRRAATKARVQLAQTWRELLLITQGRSSGVRE